MLKPKTAIILHNNEIAAFPIVISETLIAVNISWKSHTVLMINCYAPPKEDINLVSNQIEEIIRNQKGHVLVVGDFNAKNPIW